MDKAYRVEHCVSAEFRRVARRFRMAPARLAQLLCDDFACRPPNELLIISCAPQSYLLTQAGSDDQAHGEMSSGTNPEIGQSTAALGRKKSR
jgi:hypothetical protein